MPYPSNRPFFTHFLISTTSVTYRLPSSFHQSHFQRPSASGSPSFCRYVLDADRLILHFTSSVTEPATSVAPAPIMAHSTCGFICSLALSSRSLVRGSLAFIFRCGLPAPYVDPVSRRCLPLAAVHSVKRPGIPRRRRVVPPRANVLL